MDIGHTAKVLATGTGAILTGGKPVARAGAERLAFRKQDLQGPDTIRVSSDAFLPGQSIPIEHSSDGKNISPPLKWSNLPPGCQSLVLVVEDPDAPLPEPFVHWLAYNLPPTIASISAAVPHENCVVSPPMLQGKNSGLKIGYAGAAPPKGDDAHHYHFQLFALDVMLPLEGGEGRTVLFDAMAGHVLARGELVGTYRR